MSEETNFREFFQIFGEIRSRVIQRRLKTPILTAAPLSSAGRIGDFPWNMAVHHDQLHQSLRAQPSAIGQMADFFPMNRDAKAGIVSHFATLPQKSLQDSGQIALRSPESEMALPCWKVLLKFV